MEADLRRDVLPQPDLRQACGGELTHALSEESGVTADSSTSALYGDADSSLAQSIGWTDEKHNLYLDLLERSFVDQLNHSKRMCDALSEEDLEGRNPSLQQPRENCASSDEFKVLQNGCWQKINYQTQRMRNSSDYHVTESSWICHLIPDGNGYPLQSDASLQHGNEGVRVTGIQTCGLANTSMQQSVHRTRHSNPIGGTAEVTDQNFVDEDRKQSSSYPPVAKRARRSTADGSSNDQVVPSGEFHKADASVCSKYVSSKEHQGRLKSLSNDPD